MVYHPVICPVCGFPSGEVATPERLAEMSYSDQQCKGCQGTEANPGAENPDAIFTCPECGETEDFRVTQSMMHVGYDLEVIPPGDEGGQPYVRVRLDERTPTSLPQMLCNNCDYNFTDNGGDMRPRIRVIHD